jgi:hypothetical protein
VRICGVSQRVTKAIPDAAWFRGAAGRVSLDEAGVTDSAQIAKRNSARASWKFGSPIDIWHPDEVVAPSLALLPVGDFVTCPKV